MAIVLRKPTATACPASHEVMVRYVESCDRGPMRAVAVRLGRADACKIPKGDIAGYCVVRPTWPIDAVRFRRPTGRFFNLTNSRVLPEARIWHRVTLPV